MKVLLFGANGQVGKDCAQALVTAGYGLVSSSRADTDFSDSAAVFSKVIDEAPGLVINACAYTAVDKAEDEKALANKVNHLSPQALAQSCAELSIPLLQLSTDYVFDGQGDKPYKENAKVSPLGVYGSTKLAGEKSVQESLPEHIILRTSWVFGEQGNNFVKTMLRLAEGRDELNVVNDQFGRPTYVGTIVDVILFFVEQYTQNKTLPWGTYHCSNQGAVSWFEFAEAIFAQAKEQGVLDKAMVVNPIPSSEFPTPAPRPAYSVLDTHKLETLMKTPLPHWELGLTTFLHTIKQH